MIHRLLKWMDESTCNFLAVATICKELDKAGFIQLDPRDEWDLECGGKYYVVKNDSAVFAFIVGVDAPGYSGFRIISSHSDSPCFKIKPNCEIYGEGGVVSLNIEKYGGGIMYTWFDRPLSISGRIMTQGSDFLHPVTTLVDLKRPVCTIPHLAIHFNREVNEGNKLSVQKDMKPVVGYFTKEQIDHYKERGGVVKCLVAEHLGIQPEEIIDYELNLYPAQEAQLIGTNQEYFQSGRIDDLSMAFASLEALLQESESPCGATRVMAVFDNEETGSGTKQGAHSPVLREILERICLCVGFGPQAFYRTIANSFMISADDAHAWHPNYNDKYDPTNHPVIGGGPVVKINANCKYMTDADGAAVFHALCEEAGVKCQYFVNHSDVAGGSTLGNILTGQLDLRGVDMGAAIWAMHSVAETAGVQDHLDIITVFRKFYS
ncbi:MAG: M18 family aminopeptidase [Muribaculaceae bacterium]|nr:M18 family aminopeptidase [Muribaculaceae bacterium]